MTHSINGGKISATPVSQLFLWYSFSWKVYSYSVNKFSFLRRPIGRNVNKRNIRKHKWNLSSNMYQSKLYILFLKYPFRTAIHFLPRHISFVMVFQSKTLYIFMEWWEDVINSSCVLYFIFIILLTLYYWFGFFCSFGMRFKFFIYTSFPPSVASFWV